MHFLRRFSDNCPLKVKMISYIALPDEIMEDIISRLPPKSVGQCRCVCKLWQAIIGRPEFIRVHCNRIRNLREEPLIFESMPEIAIKFLLFIHFTTMFFFLPFVPLS
uniref:F-box domain-containing protein n=1 Tax=Opuntia streptacantha TaxID=393608 RepID=A0A7C9AWH0_OPUST